MKNGCNHTFMAVAITSIIGIVILEAIALFNGINGTLLTMTIGALAAAGGIAAGKSKIGDG